MHWLICGTYPSDNPQLLTGRAGVKLSAGAALSPDARETDPWPQAPPDSLVIYNFEQPALAGHIPVERGTAALAAAASLASRVLDAEPLQVLMAGDNGRGNGSRLVYRYLYEHASSYSGWGITFHYLLPDVDWHNRILAELEALPQKPLLCADAGYMYAAKMSGYASSYDLFTPDPGELAFLADEKAPHPFYTRGFLLSGQSDDATLIELACKHKNSARFLLVKGQRDLVAEEGRIISEVCYPMVPQLEPIGGTGDTVAGMACALLSSGCSMVRACTVAALANRFMGQLAQPNPATRISELLAQLPGGLRLAMQETE